MSEELIFLIGVILMNILFWTFIHIFEIKQTKLENKMELEKQVEQLENIRKEAIEYLTSYESISTIQGLDAIEKNKILDEKTMNEMVNRYLKVHDNLLNILNKGDNNVKDKR